MQGKKPGKQCIKPHIKLVLIPGLSCGIVRGDQPADGVGTVEISGILILVGIKMSQLKVG